jgi:hypothetical protein
MPDVLREYPSKSNPGKSHQVIQGRDGVVYCTCWGWKRTRSCRHLIDYNNSEPAWEETDNKAVSSSEHTTRMEQIAMEGIKNV